MCNTVYEYSNSKTNVRHFKELTSDQASDHGTQLATAAKSLELEQEVEGFRLLEGHADAFK